MGKAHKNADKGTGGYLARPAVDEIEGKLVAPSFQALDATKRQILKDREFFHLSFAAPDIDGIVLDDVPWLMRENKKTPVLKVAYDTPDLWLYNHGYTLEVTEEGEGDFTHLQRFKSIDGQAHDGVLERIEFPARIVGAVPYVEAIADKKLRKAFREAGLQDRIVPVAIQARQRDNLFPEVAFRGAAARAVKISLDPGRIFNALGHHHDLMEIEVETMVPEDGSPAQPSLVKDPAERIREDRALVAHVVARLKTYHLGLAENTDCKFAPVLNAMKAELEANPKLAKALAEATRDEFRFARRPNPGLMLAA